MGYEVDIHDLKFQLFDWLPAEDLLGAEKFADWDMENVEMVIDEAVRIAREELGPTNEDGDRIGSHWEDGRVTVPESFKSAYQTVREGGWVGCVSSPEYGGLGLPDLVGAAVNELFAGANLSFSLSSLLTRGTAHLIENFGTDELKATYCERLISGEWTGTMCLTEPQAGSDVGASTSKAEPQDDGSYLISGEKIFITYGEHDMTDNIVHAVLARTPDAPAGTRGLSLFAVPKFRVAADGALGEPNDVYCAGVEHKLGIHGSPTCSIIFGREGACQGFLLGEEGQGMRQMFQMMNSARLEVGLQAAAVAGAAQQAALAYAKERLQMRHWTGGPGQVPIVEHPDVRRMLLSSSAYVQAMRALLLRTAYYIDMAHVAEGEERERYQALVELLTPVCKAWCSDWGFRVTEWCLQVFGGYGYTRDYPAEQYLRDNKIASIYEGTNGIQALDFVARKLPARGGQAVREVLGAAAATAKELAGDDQLGGSARLLGEAVAQIGAILEQVPKRDDGRLIVVLNAVPMLDSFGTLLGAHFLLEQASMASGRLAELLAEKGVDPADARELLESNEDAAFLHNKVQSAMHFCYRALPSVTAQSVAILAGEKTAMEAVF
ncbi:MAG: acyl-CoA dehydrogenase [bacterium]|nr:acyl-CoA dehydrogenase [bacterium]